MRSDTGKAMMKAIKNGTQEEAIAVMQKYSSPVVPTDRGIHYYKTLSKNYIMGTPMKNDKLAILLGLHTHVAHMNSSNIDIGDEVITEIREKIGGLSEVDIRTVQKHLVETGNMIINPLYDNDFSGSIYDLLDEHEI